MTGLAVAVATLGTLGVGAVSANHQDGQRQGAPMRSGRMMNEGGPMAMAHMNLRQLGLSEEQKQQVKTIVGNHRTEFQALRERAVPARRALADAVASGDETAIRQRSAELSAVQTDTALLAARVHGEIVKILTPEQQQKAQALRKEFQDRADRRRGRGRAF
jgi:Spy/CpxP family protein refolding chaperone